MSEANGAVYDLVAVLRDFVSTYPRKVWNRLGVVEMQYNESTYACLRALVECPLCLRVKTVMRSEKRRWRVFITLVDDRNVPMVEITSNTLLLSCLSEYVNECPTVRDCRGWDTVNNKSDVDEGLVAFTKDTIDLDFGEEGHVLVSSCVDKNTLARRFVSNLFSKVERWDKLSYNYARNLLFVCLQQIPFEGSEDILNMLEEGVDEGKPVTKETWRDVITHLRS